MLRIGISVVVQVVEAVQHVDLRQEAGIRNVGLAGGVEADAPAAEEVLGLAVQRLHLGGHHADAELDADTLVLYPGCRQVELVGVGFLLGKYRAECLGGDIGDVQHVVAIAMRVGDVVEDTDRCRRRRRRRNRQLANPSRPQRRSCECCCCRSDHRLRTR